MDEENKAPEAPKPIRRRRAEKDAGKTFGVKVKSSALKYKKGDVMYEAVRSDWREPIEVMVGAASRFKYVEAGGYVMYPLKDGKRIMCGPKKDKVMRFPEQAEIVGRYYEKV